MGIGEAVIGPGVVINNTKSPVNVYGSAHRADNSGYTKVDTIAPKDSGIFSGLINNDSRRFGDTDMLQMPKPTVLQGVPDSLAGGIPRNAQGQIVAPAGSFFKIPDGVNITLEDKNNDGTPELRIDGFIPNNPGRYGLFQQYNQTGMPPVGNP